jgi:threonine/homoserine/homoserine lactone efflux protein
MTPETLLAVLAFATVTSITPGPNNLMLLASGVRHGFRASVPHIFGISIGFMILLAAAGLGLGRLLVEVPQMHGLLRMVGVGYLVWMAWQLWRAEAPTATGANAGSAGRPMGFWAAAAFQWVNPKAWMMAISAVTGFISPQEGVTAVLGLALLCATINLPCVTVWALGGARLSQRLNQPTARRAFNAVMALLLLASALPMLQP